VAVEVDHSRRMIARRPAGSRDGGTRSRGDPGPGQSERSDRSGRGP